MGIFDQMLTNLVSMDFFQVLFPFLLAVAIFWGVFKFSKLDEKLTRGPAALITLILSFFVMLYAKQIPGLSYIITAGAGSTLAIGVAILFIIIILGLFGLKTEEVIKGDEKGKRPWLGLIIILIVVYIVIVGLWGVNPLAYVGVPYIGGADIWTIILFLVIIAIAWHFMAEEKPAAGSAPPNK